MTSDNSFTSHSSSDRPRLSVVIPACNEEQGIGQTLDQLTRAGVWEIIVADGGSTDRTAEVCRTYGAKVVGSPPGRGQQLNSGAAAATGDVLLFLHADTTLPPGFDGDIFMVLSASDVVAGAFTLRIGSANIALRLIEKCAGWRSRFLQMPYGDQAIFLKTETFRSVGGFPDIPVMEDFEIIRRLRRLGKIRIVDAPAITSARRWHDQGAWRTTLINQCCIGAYLMGVSPARISRWR